MSSSIAVLISDIHFNLTTLPIASQALRAALNRAEVLNVPLIIAGDLQDTKAIVRAEVMNELIDILKSTKVKVFILRGNHDQVHEKIEEHALNYLRPYAEIVDSWYGLVSQDSQMILVPYLTDPSSIPEKLLGLPTDTILIMHQGFLGAQMGDYIQDKSSISPDVVKDFPVISGHYHRHQTLGTVTYIGSPYTITFGEANDGPKGFLILNQDGTFTREILDLRRHIKIECKLSEIGTIDEPIRPEDLLWLKVSAPQSELKKLNKREIGERLLGHSNFKLDLIPGQPKEEGKVEKPKLNDNDLLDSIIDEEQETDTQRKYLKSLWKELI